MLYKSALLVLLGLGASVALADDDLDALIKLEDQVKARFDHQLNLRKIKYILDGVSSACLEHRCFEEGSLKIKVDASCESCSVWVNLGDVEALVKADGKSKILTDCIRIGKPGNCDCDSSLTRLRVKRQFNEKSSITINSVALLWVSTSGEHTIFTASPQRTLDEAGEIVIYSLKDIKNSDAFMKAKVGSCQN